MLPTIYEDARTHPELFHWFGVSRPEFEAWLKALPLRVHPELVEFWRGTGGGDLFESETILGPLVVEESDNVLKVNDFHWSKGMPCDMLIFHVGLNVSASYFDRRGQRNRLASFKRDSYEVGRTFDTFGDWYRENLRSELAARYGL